MPGTLLAAIEAPVPVQQQTTAWSARPSATSRAAASEAQAQSSRSPRRARREQDRSWPRFSQLLGERLGDPDPLVCGDRDPHVSLV